MWTLRQEEASERKCKTGDEGLAGSWLLRRAGGCRLHNTRSPHSWGLAYISGWALQALQRDSQRDSQIDSQILPLSPVLASSSMAFQHYSINRGASIWGWAFQGFNYSCWALWGTGF